MIHKPNLHVKSTFHIHLFSIISYEVQASSNTSTEVVQSCPLATEADPRSQKNWLFECELM